MSHLHALSYQLTVASGIPYWHNQVSSTRQNTILRQAVVAVMSVKLHFWHKTRRLCKDGITYVTRSCSTTLAILHESAGSIVVFRSLFFIRHRPHERDGVPPRQDPAYQCTSGHRWPERAIALRQLPATPAHPLLPQFAPLLHLLLHCQTWSVCWSLGTSLIFAAPWTCA